MRIYPLRRRTWISLATFCCLFLTAAPASSAPSQPADCAQISDPRQRLACYDDLTPPPEPAAPAAESYLSRLWQLDDAQPRRRFALMVHRANYILPGSYNEEPNQAPFSALTPSQELLRTEVKFQLSIKSKLWQDIFDHDVDLWFGYTQLSLWQLYRFADSSPFRETNYEPELLFNFRTNYDMLGLRGRMINIGVNHQSNGQSEPLSRSWNRIITNLGFERGNFTLLVTAWYRLPESAVDDDNPDMDDYLGYGELRGSYCYRNQRFGLLFRNNLRSDTNRSTFELEWSVPLLPNVGLTLQYFYGYGESLLDYDHCVNRLSIGVILVDW